jgi:putative serine protease PepD
MTLHRRKKMTASTTAPLGQTPDPVDEWISSGRQPALSGALDTSAPRRRRWLTTALALVTATLGFAGARLYDAQPAESTSAHLVAAETVQTSDDRSLSDIITTAMDSIVSVKTVSQASAFNGPFGGDQVEGEGSGVVIRSDGIILTNAHVIEGASEIEVTTADGEQTLDATVVGSDAEHDLAILKVDSDDLKAITIGSSDQLQLGDSVVALGYPLGLGTTATQGIVSGLDRTIQVGDGPFDATELSGLLQTDAAITPATPEEHSSMPMVA